MPAKTPYAEVWLEMAAAGKKYRAALLVPEGHEYPDDFHLSEIQTDNSTSSLYVTDWHLGIVKAKRAAEGAASFYTERKIKFLFFREIRPPKEI
ncbi:MAG: hypothetical protein R6V83_04170 [Candidatus Thorarchaeota archaeon]